MKHFCVTHSETKVELDFKPVNLVCHGDNFGNRDGFKVYNSIVENDDETVYAEYILCYRDKEIKKIKSLTELPVQFVSTIIDFTLDGKYPNIIFEKDNEENDRIVFIKPNGIRITVYPVAVPMPIQHPFPYMEYNIYIMGALVEKTHSFEDAVNFVYGQDDWY